MIIALLIVIVLLIVFISKVNSLSNRIIELEREIGAFRDSQHSPAEERITSSTAPAQAIPSPSQVASTDRPVGEGSPDHQIPPVVAPKPSRSREEWEALIGGKVLNRIGALAIIIATAFFLKLAFDRDLIGETGRVLIGGLAGAICLAAAYRTRTRGFEIFAQGLVGAGIAILYLSVYASFNYYQLVPQWLAFLLMSVVTLVTLIQGLYYNSLAVAMLGWAGGFLTPFLLSAGEPNEIGLFTYVALLDIGLLSVYLYRGAWKVLEPLILGGTWILYVSWFDPFYAPDDLGVTAFFVIVFWALFFGMDIIRSVKKLETSVLSRIVSGANAFIAFLALYSIVDPEYHEWMGGITVLLGFSYLAAGVIPERFAFVAPVMRKQNIIISLLLLVIATEIQFTEFAAVLFWSFEAGLILWVATRLRDRELFLAAGILLVCTLLRWMAVDEAFFHRSPEDFVLILNQRFGTTLIMVLAFGAGSWFIRVYSDFKPKWLREVFDSLAVGGLLLLLTIELNDLFRLFLLTASGDGTVYLYFLQVISFMLLWAAISLVFVWAGVRLQSNSAIIWGVGSLFVAMLIAMFRGLVFAPLSEFVPVLNVRFGSLLILVSLVAIQARRFGKLSDTGRWYRYVGYITRYGILVLLFTLLSGETRDFFQRQIMESSGDRSLIGELRDMQQLSLSGVWILYSAALMTLGIWRSMRGIRIAAFGLFGFTILKIFLYDLSFLDTIYRILSFLVLGVVLLAVSFAYQRFKHSIFGTSPVTQSNVVTPDQSLPRKDEES